MNPHGQKKNWENLGHKKHNTPPPTAPESGPGDLDNPKSSRCGRKRQTSWEKKARSHRDFAVVS